MGLDQTRRTSVKYTPTGANVTPAQANAADAAADQLYPKGPGGGPVVGPAPINNTPQNKVSPTKPMATPTAAPQPQANPYGSQSGPGILEQWFNMRANGTDPGWQYAMGRGMDDIDRRMAAAGSYNSGARGQQLSDFATNMGAQREAQLDSLAAGASGEHTGRLNAMFGQGLGLAGGEAGISGAYDTAAANSMAQALAAALGFYGNKAGVDSQSNQQGISNLFGLGSLIFGNKK